MRSLLSVPLAGMLAAFITIFPLLAFAAESRSPLGQTGPAEIELQLRWQHYRQAASEALEIRRELAVEALDELTAVERMQKLQQRLERVEKWKDQLRNELAELDRRVSAPIRPGVTPVGTPSGHYVIVLKRQTKDGGDTTINVRVDGNRITCVNSTRKELIGMEGELRDVGTAFRVWLKQGEFAETHTWIPATEGRFRVLESPDRGENQFAIPVPDERLNLD